MEDYNRRQLQAMSAQLRAYQAGKIDLKWLIASLESLLACLQGSTGPWREEMRHHWETLEEVYSVAVVREQPIESSGNRAWIDPAVTSMLGLLSEQLAAESGSETTE